MISSKPSLRAEQLVTIHRDRQTAILATLLLECPSPIPKQTLQLIRHAPESFDDLRFGYVARAAYEVHLSGKPVSFISVKEQLAGVTVDLTEFWQFLHLQPSALTTPILEFESEELWNAYSFRRKATLYNDAAMSMIAAPREAASIDLHVRRALDDLDNHKNGDGLPEIICARNLLRQEIPLPDLLIDGILHKGTRLSLGGGSKTFKSWTLLSMALAVATGTPWLGKETLKSKVLILNFEIASVWMRYRVDTLCRKTGIYPEDGWLELWNLDGFVSDHNIIIPKVIARAKALGYGLIIIDPSYMLMGSGDENSASDVGLMMRSFKSVAVDTGAAVGFAAHFAKGNAAHKESIDRVSGSGVFARAPDTILTFTAHKEPNCYTVEATLRNLPQLEPFVVEWQFPMFNRKDDLNPSDLKTKPGRPPACKLEEIVALLKDQPLSSSAWQQMARAELGIAASTFYTMKSNAEKAKLVCQLVSNRKWTIKP